MDARLERGEQTRRDIVAAATKLFAEHGFDHVSVDALLRATGLSKGALYHHFAGKEAVFQAVLEAMEQSISARLLEAARTAETPLAALHAGAVTWLQLAATDRAVRQIVLLDAPLAVGWRAWRATSDHYTLGLIRSAVAAATDARPLGKDQIDLIAHMIMAMLIEAALMIAEAPDNAAVAERAQRIVGDGINGLLARP